MGEEPCNIELGLALGVGHGHAPSLPVRFGGLFPPRMKEEEAREERHIEDERHMVKFKSKIGKEEESEVGNDQEGARKKLRLNKEQLASLEGTFRVHSILNPSQKQELAKQLNLRPRQVEVWFQNRRARTKLKQTEVDCELLKKCCESLSHENQRLKKELQELRSARPRSPPPFYIRRLKAPELAVCPSCERMKQSSSMAC